ncbi:MAG: FixH family protein [Sphingobacteriia bacterium]|nr:FixH family protein [Sphingobacteriia bacterium]
MNWGYKLLFVFAAFATLIGVLVYKSMNTKFELVSKEYYKDELRYQDNIDGSANAAKLSGINITQTENYVAVSFPKEQNGFTKTGDIWFYCATDASKDLRKPLNVNNNGEQLFFKKDLLANNYLVKISWKVGNTNYYSEKKFALNK